MKLMTVTFGKKRWYLWQRLGLGLTLIIIAAILRWRWDSYRYSVPDVIHMQLDGRQAVSRSEASCVAQAAALHSRVVIHSDRPRALRANLSAQLAYWPPSLDIRKWKPTGKDALLETLDILRTYGGVFLASDVFLLKNLNEWRYYETTVSLKGDNIQTEILAAAMGSKFIEGWSSNYREYIRTSNDTLMFPPLTENVHRVRDAVLPVFKEEFFIPSNINPEGVFGVQLR